MKISVIIPAYNAADTLLSAVASVLSQTAIDLLCEIIIVNDGSKDKTLEIMQQIKEDSKKIPVVLIDKKNGGVSSARNAGIVAAKGDWIALLDSDDEWLPNKIQVQSDIIKDHPEIDFLGCQNDNQVLKILNRRIDTLYKANVKDLCLKHFPATPTILFRKSITEKSGLFDEKQKYAEDGNFCLRVCENGNYFHTPQSLVITGHGKPSFGSSGLSANLKGMYEGNVKNIRELKQRKSITISFYLFLRVFYYAKHLRRILITKFR